MARPKKEQNETRNSRINIRLTADERSEVEARAAQTGKSVHEFSRLAVLNQRIAATASNQNHPASTQMIVALNRIGVNLNQIARNLNAMTGFSPTELEATLRDINRLLDDWQGVGK